MEDNNLNKDNHTTRPSDERQSREQHRTDERQSRDQYRQDKQPKLSSQTKITIGVVVIVLGFIVSWFVYSIGQNLQSVFDNRPGTTMEVRNDVGKEVYDDQLAVAEQLRQQQEEERKRQLNQQAQQLADQQEIQSVQQEEELLEGNEWYWDINDGTLKQRPIVPNETKYTDESLEQQRESNYNEFFSNDNINIIPPREDVIFELSKDLVNIKEDKIYLTKGQFIFWVQDNLLYLAGNNEIQTFWDSDTLELTVVTHYGNKEEVEELTRQRIEIAYRNSRFGTESPDGLVLTYQ